jgi:toxin YhaV
VTELTSPSAGLVLNGWTILMWPAFDVRWTNLLRTVIRQQTVAGAKPVQSSEATMLRTLVHVIRDRIAADPNAPAHRLRPPLGAWRRVKLLGRFRLFYRFSSAHRTVILTWLNDEYTLRKDGANSDPYVVFSNMLRRGEVPDDWAALSEKSSSMPKALP